MPAQKIAGGLLAGLGATLFMEYASTWLYGRQSADSRGREEQLRTETPTTTLVRKTADVVGRELELRRASSPLKAGLGVATGMEVVVDQGMNTALGLTAPPQTWPWQAQARGVAAHAVYGVALGLLLAAGERGR